MNEKMIEPTVAMVDEAANAMSIDDYGTGLDRRIDSAQRAYLKLARITLRAALNHPDARGLFAGEDDRPWEPLNGPVRVGDEVRQERPGLTITGVVGRLDAEEDPWTADDLFIGEINLGTWYVRRAAQELPTEDGAVIVPVEGREFIEAEVNGQTYITREAVVCQTDFGPANVLQGAWRRVDDGARSEGQMARHCITPGTWKVDDQ